MPITITLNCSIMNSLIHFVSFCAHLKARLDKVGLPMICNYKQYFRDTRIKPQRSK